MASSNSSVCGQGHGTYNPKVQLYVNGVAITACYENDKVYVFDDDAYTPGTVESQGDAAYDKEKTDHNIRAGSKDVYIKGTPAGETFQHLSNKQKFITALQQDSDPKWANVDINQDIETMSGNLKNELVSKWQEKDGSYVMVFNTAMESSPIKLVRDRGIVTIKMWVEFFGAANAAMDRVDEAHIATPSNSSNPPTTMKDFIKEGFQRWQKTYAKTPGNTIDVDEFGMDDTIQTFVEIIEAKSTPKQRVLPIILLNRNAFAQLDEDNLFDPDITQRELDIWQMKANDSASNIYTLYRSSIPNPPPLPNPNPILPQSCLDGIELAFRSMVNYVTINKLPTAPTKIPNAKPNPSVAKDIMDYDRQYKDYYKNKILPSISTSQTQKKNKSWSVSIEDCAIIFYKGKIRMETHQAKGQSNYELMYIEYVSHWFSNAVSHEVGHAFGIDHAYGEPNKKTIDPTATGEIQSNDTMWRTDQDLHFIPSPNDMEMILAAWKLNNMQYFTGPLQSYTVRSVNEDGKPSKA